MTVWEKTLVNIQKGYTKLTVFASIFSERARAEINIVRIRMEIDSVQRSIAEQQQLIGKKLLDLKDGGDLPRTFAGDEIASALEQIERLNRELEIHLDDLQNEAEVLKAAPARQDERSA